ncbi:MAG: glycosyltransferase family A protein [Oscillospiraceae bacterium]
MSKILTVVIPSYNVEKFLNNTLNSFICDESIMDEIEVFIVDDGSKDNTAKIGLEYEKKYPKTFKVISKENGGHGSTINKGIENATGKYFKVVDGDDWVNTPDFITLISKLKNCNSDYVFTNYYEYYDDVNEQKSVDFLGYEDGKECRFVDIAAKGCLPMHALVIKTAILQNNNIRLDEKCFYVDVEYVLFPIPYVETVTFFNLYIYMYRLALDTQSVSILGFKKHINDHIRVCLHILDFINDYKNSANPSQEYINYLEKRCAEIICTQSVIFSSFPLNDKETQKNFKEFDEKVREKNNNVTAMSSAMSKKLMLLRKFDFKFYKPIQILSKLMNK